MDINEQCVFEEISHSKMKDILIEKFLQLYGTNNTNLVRVFAAPARINIIGEHIDYNGGRVFPAAIDRYLYVVIRVRSDDSIIYDDIRFPGRQSFHCSDNFSYAKKDGYCNYLNGILSIMKNKGFILPCGFELLLFSQIPAGGGVSSSSALECGFAYAVAQLFGFAIDRVSIAKIGQESEHAFMNVQCGIMDQFIIATARAGTAMNLDCANLDYTYVPLVLGAYQFVVMNTNKQRCLADSKYNERRSECMQALELIRGAMVKSGAVPVENLCSLSLEQIEKYKSAITDAVLFRRVRHCVTENIRVQEAVTMMVSGDLIGLGKLLGDSHRSLRDDYEVTGKELDTLVQAASAIPECLGARMTGAGFGGCAIALVQADAVPRFISYVQSAYTATIGYEANFFPCGIGSGVCEL